MTDKIGSDGSPSGIGCTDPGTCFSVYHSCTRPFRIVGDVSNGAVPRSEYTCPSLESINVGWPTSWTGDNGESVQASVPGVYRRISAVWSADEYTLTAAPEAYREDTGALGRRVYTEYNITVWQTLNTFFGYHTSKRQAIHADPDLR